MLVRAVERRGRRRAAPETGRTLISHSSQTRLAGRRTDDASFRTTYIASLLLFVAIASIDPDLT